MIRKSGIRFSEKIMLKQKARAGCRSNRNSSRARTTSPSARSSTYFTSRYSFVQALVGRSQDAPRMPTPGTKYNQGLRSHSAGRVAEIHTPDHMAASRRERTTARGDGLRKRDSYKRDLGKYAACGAHLLLQPRVCRPILRLPRLDLPQADRSFSALFRSAWANSSEG